MRKIDQLFSEYGESHQNPTNKAVHWVCVPLIFFSIVGLIASVPARILQSASGQSPYLTWATVGLFFVMIYYFTLSIPLTIGMVIFSAACLIVAHLIELLDIAPLWAVSLGIFVIAWIGQFYGHKIEGKKPTFLKDIQFLLIGPAWLMHFLFKRIGIPY